MMKPFDTYMTEDELSGCFLDAWQRGLPERGLKIRKMVYDGEHFDVGDTHSEDGVTGAKTRWKNLDAYTVSQFRQWLLCRRTKTRGNSRNWKSIWAFITITLNYFLLF